MSDTFEFDDKARVERLVGTLHDPAATTGDVLTVQADKSIAAQPGGGGSGGVQVVTVPISSAQILDLANTDVTLIAGVAGNVTVVTGSAIAYLAGLTPYLDGGGAINVATRPSSPGAVTTWFSEPGLNFWDQSTSQVAAQGYGATIASDILLSDWNGQDVVLFEDTANPTLGDGTLLVTLSYFLAPTV